ncbi:MAG: RDD family protein [Nitrososphaerales archaeon]
MPYCRSCGKELPLGATYCPNCGANNTGGASVNEFDRITKDSRTQEHWIRRTVAYIIDWVVVSVATAVLTLIAYVVMGISTAAFGTNFFFPFGALGFGILGLSALLFLLYFTIMEGIYSKTIGKSFLGLHVATLDNKPMNVEKAFVRNISKIYWLLLLLDLIGGFFLNVKPGQRYLDSIAKTIVTS